MRKALRTGIVAGAAIAASQLLAPPTSLADLAEPSAPAGGTVACTITDPRITEASGLAAADDHMYVINDGGTQVTVFELGPDCRVLREIDNATDPYDVEDLARTGDGTLWLADIGDNEESRDTVALEVLAPSGDLTLYRMSYPDGPHDAETLLLDKSRRPYLVTKSPFGRSGVYTPAQPLRAGATTPLRKVTTVQFLPTGTPGGPVRAVSQVLATGGAVSPDGSRVVLRTYTDLYVWAVHGGDIEAALRDGKPTRVALPTEKQGESVAFTPDGRSLLTVSEGSPVPVYSVPLPAVAEKSTERTRNQPEGRAAESDEDQDQKQDKKKSGSSRPVLANLAISALVATVIMGGIGRLRRRK